MNFDQIISAGNDESIISFDWNLIDICNYKCTYCAAGYGHDETRPAGVFKESSKMKHAYINVLDRLSLIKSNTYEVSLVGGEPTLHPNMFDIIECLCGFIPCESVSIVTNGFRDVSYFKRLQEFGSDKICLCVSIHFEYYKKGFIEKYIELNKLTNVKFEPIVMLHPDERYWEHMKHTLDAFNEHGIKYSVSFIESTRTKEIRYSDVFHNEFTNYINKADDNKFKFKTKQSKVILNRQQIELYGFKRFKGWQCTPKLWLINEFGEILNSCTREGLDYLNRNLNSCVECPLDVCGCDIKWNSPKYRST